MSSIFARIRNHESQEQIVAARKEFWLKARRKHEKRSAHGENLEAILPGIVEKEHINGE